MIALIGKYHRRNRFTTLINRLLHGRNALYSNRVKFIKISNHDCFAGESTIAEIAYPIVKRLQNATGFGMIEDSEDLPEEIRKRVQNDPFDHDAHTWIFEEILWGLNEIRKGFPGEEKIIHNHLSHEASFPSDELREYRERLQRSTRLFGDRFLDLWW